MIGKRLKEARKMCGMTQERLGVMIGIEEATARQRISQYELGTHTPKFSLACQMAELLGMPECYFYVKDDEFAKKVLDLYREELKHRT
ncbi:helix-turn-helix transcriptional regulator [Rahnella sp. CG8]|uniref:helix-turn-helix transcriptional regulator n=1 Tax=Rahnella sp. CG8 TaxID=2726078 RepID=UPI002033C674|nr:helix-turn-helix transcriptional regulator [Rahnella sp. CG8]MCM2446912.1 helix-turn-helix transcriptional regulator [Rahnella sp. CG8]